MINNPFMTIDKSASPSLPETNAKATEAISLPIYFKPGSEISRHIMPPQTFGNYP